MATTPNSAVTPQTVYFGAVSLAAVTACTTRAPTAVSGAAAANIFQVLPVPANGARIDRANVKACSSSITASSAAQVVVLWMSDGTTLTPILSGEIQTTVVAPSTTAISGEWFANFDKLNIPSGGSIWASTTITTTAATTALSVTINGAAY